MCTIIQKITISILILKVYQMVKCNMKHVFIKVHHFPYRSLRKLDRNRLWYEIWKCQSNRPTSRNCWPWSAAIPNFYSASEQRN